MKGQLQEMIERHNRPLTVCEPLARAILEGINTRFDYILSDSKAKLAAVVIPKFKTDWIDNLSHKVEVVQALKRACSAVQTPVTQHETDAAPAEQVSESTDFFARFATRRQNELTSNDNSTDADRYLTDTSSELLSLVAYPIVKKLYLQLNTGLPASAAVERLFSLGGRVFTPLRSRLSNNHFEMMMFLRAAKW
jgi:hypothetical protein